MDTAKFVKEIMVIDPDTKGEVELSVFKHENGGMFALDSSYIVQVLPEEGDCLIPDPFVDDYNADTTAEVLLTGV
jgi:hypothetical protein